MLIVHLQPKLGLSNLYDILAVSTLREVTCGRFCHQKMGRLALSAVPKACAALHPTDLEKER